MWEYIWVALVAFGVPAAITGFIVRRFEKRLSEQEAKREAERLEKERKAEEKERNREKISQLQLSCIMATMALSEATAKAVQRIPDAHCNGDMTSALKGINTIRTEYRTFLTELGMHYLYDDN